MTENNRKQQVYFQGLIEQMKRKHRLLALRPTCPVCGAKPGKMCREAGHRRSYHRERHNAYLREVAESFADYANSLKRRAEEEAV